MTKKICFDMDGTIANLYGVNNWLQDLRNEQTRPYRDAQTLYNMSELIPILHQLQNQGWEIGIITWSAKGGTKEYNRQVAKVKKEWLKNLDFPLDFFHCVKYGTPKQYTIKKTTTYAILIDDEKPNRDRWNLGQTIEPTDELLQQLQDLL